MILGRVSKNEKRIKFDADIHCTSCGKQVPGTLRVGERYCKTQEFEAELEGFLASYLCGICRDKKRLVAGKRRVI